jgi:phosphoribosylanthranilate isomerase
MVIQVKICGITTAEAADATVRAAADFAGLAFHARSPRNLSLDAGAALADRMRQRVRIVALVCDAADEQLATIARVVRPDWLQLHGSETADRVAGIRSRFSLPVMKAIAIAEASDFAAVARLEEAADMLLFDAKPAGGALRRGGHGVAFDWQLMRGRKFTKPWLLAGGLNAENVQRAVRTSDAPGVDASSGVELSPGVKSAELIRAFVAAARTEQHAAEPQP